MFQRQSKLVLPYIIALFSCVLLVILLELLPEFIDEFGIGYFIMMNGLIAITAYILIVRILHVFVMYIYNTTNYVFILLQVVYSLYTQFAEEELNRIPY